MDSIVRLSGRQQRWFSPRPGTPGAILLNATPGAHGRRRKRLSDEILTIPTGDALLGRVLDPLGGPLDGGVAQCSGRRRSMANRPIVVCDFVDRPLYTGSKDQIDT